MNKALKRLLGALFLCIVALPYAQAASPATDALLQSADLVYLGSIKLPDITDAADYSFDYGGNGLAFNPANNSLFINNHIYAHQTAEVGIPTLSGSTATLSAISLAPVLQGFGDIMEGQFGNILAGGGHDGNPAYGGSLVYNNRLIGTNYDFYDVSNSPRLSHFTHSLTVHQAGSFQGFHQVGSNLLRMGFLNGYMASIPPEWQSSLGGPALTGNCCLGIIYTTSYGPSVSVFNPDDLGSVNPAPTQELLSNDSSHIGPWPAVTTMMVGGVVFPVGTRSVLFYGRRGAGNPCVGVGTNDPAMDRQSGFCYDPTTTANGVHDYPYTATIWAYDANDLLAVKKGNKNPWEVLPYGIWNMGIATIGEGRILGVAYDAATQRIYVSQYGGEWLYPAEKSPYSSKPLIQVFQVHPQASPPYTCPGVSCGGSSVTGGPGQLECGPGSQTFQCTPGGWQSLGSGCSCGGLPPPPPMTCPGTLCDGSPVTAGVGQTVCGGGPKNFQCTAGGWQALGTDCACTPPGAAPVITSPGSISSAVGTPFNYQITATNDPTAFGYAGVEWPNGLSLDATGLISGLPTTAGTFHITVSASNHVGSGSAPLTITFGLPSLPPNCGSLKICGTLTAVEDPTMPLQGAWLELRDSHGKLISSAKTDSNGAYSFDDIHHGLILNSTYYVSPVLGPTQSAVPLQAPVGDLSTLGKIADFQIRGWQQNLKVSGAPPGSVVLISTSAYTKSNPPPMNPNAPSRQYFATTTTGSDGAAILPVAIGSPYYITCWMPGSSGGSVNFQRTSTSSSSIPYSLTSNQTTAISCQ